jgi:hypothetical protein
MKLLPVTFVYQSALSPLSSMATGIEGYAKFMTALQRQRGISLTVIERRLAEVIDLPGYLLFGGADCLVALFECPVERQSSVALRLVPLNASRPKIFQKLLEPYSLAGAIDDMSLLEWESPNVGPIDAHGLFGRKDIANLIGATPDFLISERYAYLKSSTHDGLPHLLADYLVALDQHTNRSPSSTVLHR